MTTTMVIQSLVSQMLAYAALLQTPEGDHGSNAVEFLDRLGRLEGFSSAQLAEAQAAEAVAAAAALRASDAGLTDMADRAMNAQVLVDGAATFYSNGGSPEEQEAWASDVLLVAQVAPMASSAADLRAQEAVRLCVAYVRE